MQISHCPRTHRNSHKTAACSVTFLAVKVHEMRVTRIWGLDLISHRYFTQTDLSSMAEQDTMLWVQFSYVQYCSIVTAAGQTQIINLFSSCGCSLNYSKTAILMGVILPQLCGLHESVNTSKQLNHNFTSPSNLVMAFNEELNSRKR